MDSLSGKEKQVIPKKGPRIPDSHYIFNPTIRNNRSDWGPNQKTRIHNAKLRQTKKISETSKQRSIWYTGHFSLIKGTIENKDSWPIHIRTKSYKNKAEEILKRIKE